MEPDTTSRTVLAHSAYASDTHLAARQSLYQWQTPSYDLPGIVIDLLDDEPGPVLDVGCGNGAYLRRLRADRPDITTIGIDISLGIIEGLTPPLAVADAAQLPVPDRSVGTALAMHMLYHLADIDRGVAELARVLRPDGQLIASTNSRNDKAELDELWTTAAADVLGGDQPPRRVSLSNRFSLEDAPDLLNPHFAKVQIDHQNGVIRVPSADPVIAHLASYRTWATQIGVPLDPPSNEPASSSTNASGLTARSRSPPAPESCAVRSPITQASPTRPEHANPAGRSHRPMAAHWPPDRGGPWATQRRIRSASRFGECRRQPPLGPAPR